MADCRGISDKEVVIHNLELYSPFFIEHVKPTPLLINCRSFMEESDRQEIENLENNRSTTEAANHLLNKLVGKYLKEDGVCKIFIDALKASGYSHISEVLCGEHDYDEEIQKSQKKIIQLFAPEIHDRITHSDIFSLLMFLLRREIIRPSDQDEIECCLKQRGIVAATVKLIDVLPRYTNDWYSGFLISLLDLGEMCNTDTFVHLVRDIDPDWLKKHQSLSSDNVSDMNEENRETDSDTNQTEVLKVHKETDLSAARDKTTKNHAVEHDDSNTEETQVMTIYERYNPTNDLNAADSSDSEESCYEDAITDSLSENVAALHTEYVPIDDHSLNGVVASCSRDASENDKPKQQDSINLSIENTNVKPTVAKSFPQAFNIQETQSEISEVDNTKVPDTGARPKIKEVSKINSIAKELENTQQKTLDKVKLSSDTDRYSRQGSLNSDVEGPVTNDVIDSDEDEEEPVEDIIIELREYQKELARAGIDGKNVIVCAPTGSGKTRVALRIIQNHLSGKTNKIRKVVFIVNQVPLADQQHKECVKLLPAYKSKALTGDTQATAKEPFGETVKRNDILVITAQILVDALLYGDIPNIGVFSLIVFDECHHTHDRHPFNQIMDCYMDVKFSEDQKNSTVILPQIVGLTASLGVGKAKRRIEAMEHIFKLMSNLDAEEIATVDENQAEMATYANTPKEDLDKVNESEPDFKRNLSAPSDKGSDVYIQWVSNFRNACALLRDPAVKQYYTNCRQHLEIYNNALIINDDCRAADAVEFVVSEFGNLYRVKDETDKWLMEMFERKLDELTSINDDDPDCKNPKLVALEKLLKKAYNENPDLRGIVFVKTRGLADCMVCWMRSTDGLKDLCPTKFVGAVVHTTKGGMTQRKQKDVMDYFRGGAHKLIVATSIAQEGLDIRKCNLVVRYDHVTNEIALVQARGRARADDSVYKVIGQQGKGTVEKEELNLIREQLMLEGMRDLKAYIRNDRHKFQKEKREKQEESKTERDLKAQKRQSKVYREGVFDLLCIKCNEFCCLSTNLRVIKDAHHIVIDDRFYERVKLKTNNGPPSIDGFTKQSTILCLKCGQNWGVNFVHLGLQFPALGIKYFVIVDYAQNQTLCKKWGAAPFHVKTFDSEDKKKLLKASSSAE